MTRTQLKRLIEATLAETLIRARKCGHYAAANALTDRYAAETDAAEEAYEASLRELHRLIDESFGLVIKVTPR